LPNTFEHHSIADTPARDRVAGSVRRGEQVAFPAARGRWWRDARRRRMLAGADLLAGVVPLAVVAGAGTGSLWPVAFAPLWPLTAKLFGLYDRDHRALRHLTADEVPQLEGWIGMLTIAISLLLTLTPAGDMGAWWIVAFFLVSSVTAIGFRAVARQIWWRTTPAERVGMVGDPPVLESLRRKVGMFMEMHLVLTGERRLCDLGRDGDRRSELDSFAMGVDRIVVAAERSEPELIGQLKDICRRRQVKLSVVSPFRGKALPEGRTAQVADMPVLEYSTWDKSRSTLVLKRVFDFVVAAAALIALAPFLLAIAIAIKIDSPGPILFSQIRAGLDGRPFRMYKLRTMVVDAEAQLAELIDIGVLDEPVFKIRDDPRVTRVGRLLRRSSLDEVPQLINVLLGEMSIVGPRPEQVELVGRYSEEQRGRLAAKPGVTGPMQVFGRGELTFAERIEMELEYIENQSLGRDVRILIHTLPAVFRGTGAF
jgi:exopolysaccharide biosynthesis polyprenyl glycosylphosphotransferase